MSGRRAKFHLGLEEVAKRFPTVSQDEATFPTDPNRLFCRNCNVLALVALALNWKVCVASSSRRKPLLGLAFLWDESERS
jgi:hypothetical protein